MSEKSEKRKPVACVASLDGIDFCIATNLKSFYEKLGFVVVMTRKVCQGDVLVILRGAPPVVVDCSQFAQVHVFNCVGQDRSAMRLRDARHVVFIDYRTSLRRLRPDLSGCGRVDEILGFWHPVVPELWTHKPRSITLGTTHVGNYKRLGEAAGPADDAQAAMMALAKVGRLRIWGRGWEGVVPASCLQGSVSLWKVPQIFCRSACTLGLRYPIQREHGLISSRYWLAPLTGCTVISEESSLPDPVPGVLFAPYQTSTTFRPTVDDRNAVIEAASAFWRRRTEEFSSLLSPLLPDFTKSPRASTRSHGNARLKYAIEVGLRKVKSAIERY